MLAGKRLIVTGGGSGIGRAAALMFAQCGASVSVADWSEEGGRATTEMITGSGGKAAFHLVNVAVEADVERMVLAAVEAWGGLDGAFNNAGVPMKLKSLPDLSAEDFGNAMSVNLNGVFYCMKYEIDAMRKASGGAIVNTASTGGAMAVPFGAEYIAAKHGVVGLTRAAASEARYTKVRVNAVLPGLINTPMIAGLMKSDAFVGSSQEEAILDRHSIGRTGEPEDVARAAKWLLSDESAFINGVMLPVDGGFTAR